MANVQFACKTIPVEQILKCSFGLNKTEVVVLKRIFNETEEIEMPELIKKIKKDRTTIQRALKNLTTKNLLIRRQINLERGGYVYTYKVRDKNEVKNEITEIFNAFAEKVKFELENW